MTTVGILLAAGRSTRFGPDNKLLAELGNMPLVRHAASALEGAALDHRIAVLSKAGVPQDLLNMHCVINADPGALQSDNLRLGLETAITFNPDRVILLLGDMPFVTTETIQSVLELCRPDRCSAATFKGRILPPVALPAQLFDKALQSQGDQGARTLIKDLPDDALLAISEQEAQDIDSADDLRMARARFQGASLKPE